MIVRSRRLPEPLGPQQTWWKSRTRRARCKARAAGHNALLSGTETEDKTRPLKHTEDRKTRRETRGQLFLLASACACLQHYCTSLKKTQDKKKTMKTMTRTTNENYKNGDIFTEPFSCLCTHTHTHHWKANCTGNSFVHYKCNIVLLDMTVFIFCVRLCVW